MSIIVWRIGTSSFSVMKIVPSSALLYEDMTNFMTWTKLIWVHFIVGMVRLQLRKCGIHPRCDPWVHCVLLHMSVRQETY